MTISELIEQLESFKEKHGNVEVIVMDEYGNCPVSEIDLRDYHDGQTGKYLPGVLLSY